MGKMRPTLNFQNSVVGSFLNIAGVFIYTHYGLLKPIVYYLYWNNENERF